MANGVLQERFLTLLAPHLDTLTDCDDNHEDREDETAFLGSPPMTHHRPQRTVVCVVVCSERGLPRPSVPRSSSYLSFSPVQATPSFLLPRYTYERARLILRAYLQGIPATDCDWMQFPAPFLPPPPVLQTL